jgi:hypothetical protein
METTTQSIPLGPPPAYRSTSNFPDIDKPPPSYTTNEVTSIDIGENPATQNAILNNEPSAQVPAPPIPEYDCSDSIPDCSCCDICDCNCVNRISVPDCSSCCDDCDKACTEIGNQCAPVCKPFCSGLPTLLILMLGFIGIPLHIAICGYIGWNYSQRSSNWFSGIMWIPMGILTGGIFCCAMQKLSDMVFFITSGTTAGCLLIATIIAPIFGLAANGYSFYATAKDVTNISPNGINVLSAGAYNDQGYILYTFTNGYAIREQYGYNKITHTTTDEDGTTTTTCNVYYAIPVVATKPLSNDTNIRVPMWYLGSNSDCSVNVAAAFDFADNAFPKYGVQVNPDSISEYSVAVSSATIRNPLLAPDSNAALIRYKDPYEKKSHYYNQLLATGIVGCIVSFIQIICVPPVIVYISDVKFF